MRKMPIPTVLFALLLVGALVVYWTTFSVRFDEVAVKTRLGRVQAIFEEPGLQFKLPPPIESVKSFPTRYQVLDASEGEVKTRDGQNVIVATYAVWRIVEPRKFFISVETLPKARENLRSRINQVRSAAIGRRDLSSFVSTDRQRVDEGFDDLIAEMSQAAEPGLLADYGIELVDIGIRRISLPDEVNQSVFEQMREERNTLAQNYRAEGQAIATTIRSRAQSQADTIRSFAETRAIDIETAGIQSSVALLAEIKAKNRDFYRLLTRLDALRAILKDRTTIFLDIERMPFTRVFIDPLGVLEDVAEIDEDALLNESATGTSGETRRDMSAGDVEADNEAIEGAKLAGDQVPAEAADE